MRPYQILDIETAPNLAIVEDPAWRDRHLATIAAPSHYKDPDKIAAYRQEALAKEIRKAALSPRLGVVTCIGLMLSDGDPLVIQGQSEAQTLAIAAATLSDRPIVGFNIRDFDLPFLWVRAAIHGAPLAIPRPRDYYRVGELRDILQEGRLSDWLHAFGYPCEDWAPEDYERATLAQQAEKCRNDVMLTGLLAKKFEGALQCLQER